jgi:hypothetical protein
VAQQFNVPLGDWYALVLRALSIRDEASVPELLRPVVEGFLDGELERDSDLREAVEALTRARAAGRPASVTPIRQRRQRAGPDRPRPKE